MVLPYLHKHFAFNGLSFSTVAQLRIFAEELSHGTHEHNVPIGNFLTEWLSEHPTVSVKTSGATGTPKNIALAKANMVNSAKATAAYFNLPEKTNALLCLPTAYIAGKMMLVRAMVMGWELQAVAPGKNVIAQNDKKYDFAAMVPYQVYHSMPGLDNIKKLIVGGGAIPYNLERQLQDKTTQAYATYGMTETITHVAARPINGAQKSKHYTALPNVAFSKDPRGCLIVTAPHITPSAVTTNDSVALISPTAFTWSGRYDNVVNSGGVKLFPEKIEAKLAQKIKSNFIVTAEGDPALGKRLVLVVEEKQTTEKLDYSNAFKVLRPFEKPKKIYTLPKFPYTETGKIKRAEILKLLKLYR